MFKAASPRALDLLGGLLRWDPATRMTLSEAVVHPFFSEPPFPATPSEMPCLSHLEQLQRRLELLSKK